MASLIQEPRCSHKGAVGPESQMVSTHKDIRRAKGRMASVRVCSRPACVDEAVLWVRMMGHNAAWVNGVNRGR